jgi:hypothetical protein
VGERRIVAPARPTLAGRSIEPTEAGMKTLTRRVSLAMLTAALAAPVLAQVGGGARPGGGRRNVDGQGINYAPEPAVYSVLSVDVDARTVELRAENGRTGVVQVGPSVYDLSKIKAGDKIKVDFVVPDEKNKDLRAAAIWPAS